MIGGIERSRATNKLTDRRIKAFIKDAAAGQAQRKKLSDGGGLFMMLTPAGSASWRLKYRFGGKERLLSIGIYPAVSLEAARAERDFAKGQLRAGQDPVDARRLNRAQAVIASDHTFEAVATEWFAMRERGWSPSHFSTSLRAFERDVYPTLGRLPVASITPGLVASVIKKIVARGARETAGKVLNHCDCVFRFAKAGGMCVENPAKDVHEILPDSLAPTHHPAILEFDGLREILRLADVAALSPAVRLAIRLGAFTYSRPGNVVSAEWPEFDLDAEPARWVIPRRKMKVKGRSFDHVVILGPTIARELREWQARSGTAAFVFPSPTGKRPHITVEALDRAYSRTLGLSGKHSPHGWRAALKTLGVEVGGFSRDATELALDHVHDTAVVRAYDRGERLEERKRLAKWWDEQLTREASKSSHLRLHGAA